MIWRVESLKVTNIEYRAGLNISEQALLYRANQHSFYKKYPPRTLINNPFFSLKPQVLESYNHSLLHKPRSACGDSHSVHFIVPSSPLDLKRRNAIRDTWGSVAQGHLWPGKSLSLSLKLTFVIGVPDKGNDSSNSQKYDNLRGLETELRRVNRNENKDIGRQYYHEIQSDDILQFDIVDSYQNLTRKIISALNYVVSSCKDVQYIVKADQDIFVNVPILLSFLKHHGKRDSIYGHIYDGGMVLRKGRWAASKSIYPPDDYPVYAAGTTYVVSKSAAKTLLKLCPFFPYNSIEDAFITGVLASVGSVDRVHVDGFTHWLESKPPPCDFINDKHYVGNNMTELDLRIIWRSHLDRGRDDNC